MTLEIDVEVEAQRLIFVEADERQDDACDSPKMTGGNTSQLVPGKVISRFVTLVASQIVC